MFSKLCMQCLLLVVAQLIKLLLLEGSGVPRLGVACVHTIGSSSVESCTHRRRGKVLNQSTTK